MVWLHLWVGEMGGLLQCRVLLKLVLLVILFVVHFLCLSKENETKEKTLLHYVVPKISGF